MESLLAWKYGVFLEKRREDIGFDCWNWGILIEFYESGTEIFMSLIIIIPKFI